MNTNIITNKKLRRKQTTSVQKCGVNAFSIPDWMEITYLHHIRLIETGSKLAFNKLSKTCPVAPEFNKFQQTGMLR